MIDLKLVFTEFVAVKIYSYIYPEYVLYPVGKQVVNFPYNGKIIPKLYYQACRTICADLNCDTCYGPNYPLIDLVVKDHYMNYPNEKIRICDASNHEVIEVITWSVNAHEINKYF